MQSNKKYKRGLTFGVFDLFHIGHLNLLEQASALCDELIVFVSTKEYVLKHKGKLPIIPLRDRMKIVKAIYCVDRVYAQSSVFGKKEAVDKFKPNVLLVGDDWNKNTYSGEGLGVKVEYLTHTPGISSSILRKRLKL